MITTSPYTSATVISPDAGSTFTFMAASLSIETVPACITNATEPLSEEIEVSDFSVSTVTETFSLFSTIAFPIPVAISSSPSFADTVTVPASGAATSSEVPGVISKPTSLPALVKPSNPSNKLIDVIPEI